MATAQKDSSMHLKISLLTCSPGEELYSIFGHTALRITDSVQQTDLVYNYGTFNFEDPNFYTKFVRGKLDYFLSVDPIQNFLYGYNIEQRGITEQELILSKEEKKSIVQYLQQNLSGNNRFYKYDFLKDNCTTRIKDILIKYAGLKVTQPLVKEGTTYRNMLYQYLDAGGMPWSKLGIDILLGSPTDKKVSKEESLFLPDYLMMATDSSINTNKHLMQQKKILLQSNRSVENVINKYQPLLIFCVIFLLIQLLNIPQNNFFKKITLIINSLLLYVTGFLGILLVFMWLGTEHKACAYNYNLLWALPTNTVAAFFVWKNPSWLKKYFVITAIIYTLIFFIWFVLPQQLNVSLLPIILTLLLISIRQFRKV
jgi:hypothetical protein